MDSIGPDSVLGDSHTVTDGAEQDQASRRLRLYHHLLEFTLPPSHPPGLHLRQEMIDSDSDVTWLKMMA